jgi:hypothetical protein
VNPFATGILKLALAILISVYGNTAGVSATVRTQAQAVGTQAIQLADDALAGQMATAQTASPNPAREAANEYLQTLIGRHATMADMLPLSSAATVASLLENPTLVYQDETGVAVLGVAEASSTPSEAEFLVTTRIAPNTEEVRPYVFVRENGVWKFDMDESLSYALGRPAHVVTQVQAQVVPPAVTSTSGTP